MNKTNDSEITKVVFRKYKDNDIIAIFPEEPGNMDKHTCMSYMHIGQHGACNPSIISDTTLASKEEFQELKNELESIGYNLVVISRISSLMNSKRFEKLI